MSTRSNRVRESPPSANSSRFTFNVTNDAAAALERLSIELGISKTEVLRRSLALYQLVEAETNRNNENALVLGLFEKGEGREQTLKKHILIP